MTTLRRSFSGEPASVAASRQFVGEALTDLPLGLQDAALLMVSELATNAIVHAVTGFEVSVDRSKSTVRVEVADLGGGEPELQAPAASELHGRGLQIVEELSDEWGVTESTDDRGKTVWYKVEVRPGRLPGNDDSTTKKSRRRPTRQRSQSHRAASDSDRARSDGPDASADGSIAPVGDGHQRFRPWSQRWVA